MYYAIIQKGSGPVIRQGDTAILKYTGRFLNGRIFDTNVREEAVNGSLPIDSNNNYKPLSLVMGEKKIIAGWDEGLKLLNKGAKAIFVIPSGLAYGERGTPAIGPYTTTVYEIEVVDILH